MVWKNCRPHNMVRIFWLLFSAIFLANSQEQLQYQNTISQDNVTTNYHQNITRKGHSPKPALLYDRCGDISNPDCDSESNLICSDYELSQFSTCICVQQYIPHPNRLPVCVQPLPIQRHYGESCNPKADPEEEICADYLTTCHPNGTCGCIYDKYGQIHYKTKRGCFAHLFMSSSQGVITNSLPTFLFVHLLLNKCLN